MEEKYQHPRPGRPKAFYVTATQYEFMLATRDINWSAVVRDALDEYILGLVKTESQSKGKTK